MICEKWRLLTIHYEWFILIQIYIYIKKSWITNKIVVSTNLHYTALCLNSFGRDIKIKCIAHSLFHVDFNVIRTYSWHKISNLDVNNLVDICRIARPDHNFAWQKGSKCTTWKLEKKLLNCVDASDIQPVILSDHIFIKLSLSTKGDAAVGRVFGNLIPLGFCMTRTTSKRLGN